ncbi:SCO1860 family LAETG-anchored protein [Streptomyces sodiiphilus]|uniref:SCO1860 family LAETG-anchored protein n=1 Tax=Streptomyces sodiiphilus TaxID=226217 RepID=A0ABN2PCT8_9ACTN
MFNSAFGRPGARRAAVLLTAAGLMAAGAPAAHAEDADDRGAASAAVLRTGLDVALLNHSVELPLEVALNQVSAPAGEGSASQTLLTASLDGVDGGRPFRVLSAEVADALAESDTTGSQAEVTLVNAAVHVPGLPALSVIELEKVTARAHCPAGRPTVAEANVLGTVTVLGKQVALTAGGTTRVEVPAVGEVVLELSHRETAERSAAASALDLSVSVNPLDLNVAEVHGNVTLAAVDCRTPAGAPGDPGDGKESEKEEPGGSEAGEDGHGTQTVPGSRSEAAGSADGPDLAATGGDGRLPYLAGGAALLVAAGGGALLLNRRRRTVARAGSQDLA